jgi:hypothetical protein
MSDEEFVREREPNACLASQLKRGAGMRFQIVRRQIITTKLPAVGGWCTSEAAAWKSAAKRIRKKGR